MTTSFTSNTSEEYQQGQKSSQVRPLPNPTSLRLVLPQGQLHIHTASYRGSFSVVLSEALRSAGLGSKVLIAQFLKGGVNQGASNAVNLCGRLEWVRPSLNSCITKENNLIDNEQRKEEKKVINEVWNYCKSKLCKGLVDRLVLDEIGLAISMGFINEEDVISTLNNRNSSMDIILTGPSIPSQIMSIADQVTELRCS